MEITRRYRVNVSTSVKGVYTHDSTIEISVTDNKWVEADTRAFRDSILAESDALVAELEKRYPAVVEEKKKEEK